MNNENQPPANIYQTPPPGVGSQLNPNAAFMFGVPPGQQVMFDDMLNLEIQRFAGPPETVPRTRLFEKPAQGPYYASDMRKAKKAVKKKEGEDEMDYEIRVNKEFKKITKQRAMKRL